LLPKPQKQRQRNQQQQQQQRQQQQQQRQQRQRRQQQRRRQNRHQKHQQLQQQQQPFFQPQHQQKVFSMLRLITRVLIKLAIYILLALLKFTSLTVSVLRLFISLTFLAIKHLFAVIVELIDWIEILQQILPYL
jgi:Flp pilus assembly protein TadB